ncbi:hypothetical protein EVAR_36306_1 [Eumeta japonica]|uniref:Uncharacterized protein n=1 Tax=Eumeta variegata TaxID=151549 RepID=A0A4C1VKF8_EUMVA|nr:hypothetical protein EVAR_36306_1 [Eumeta japonica]
MQILEGVHFVRPVVGTRTGSAITPSIAQIRPIAAGDDGNDEGTKGPTPAVVPICISLSEYRIFERRRSYYRRPRNYIGSGVLRTAINYFDRRLTGALTDGGAPAAAVNLPLACVTRN